MRVLMSSWAWPSHYMPLVPLGWALRAAGHDVRVASQPALARVITDSGLVAVPVGKDLDHAEVQRQAMAGLHLTAVPAAPAPGASMRGWQPVRYMPYNGPAVLPDWLQEPSQRRRVCVSWGTSTTRIGGPELFVPPKVIDAVRDLDMELVVTLRAADVAALGDVPHGVRVVDSLPLHLVLPFCDALVHQGGNGTLLTAALYGVPQLVLPQLP